MGRPRRAMGIARSKEVATCDSYAQIGHLVTVITEDLMLTLLGSGRSLMWIAEVSGWPGRQVRTFAARHGYLCTPGGAFYRPPNMWRESC
jgi:hypothetical protein